MKVSKEGLELIKKHEGCRLEPYKDPIGLYTVGYGHLIGDGKTLPIEWFRRFTKEEVKAPVLEPSVSAYVASLNKFSKS